MWIECGNIEVLLERDVGLVNFNDIYCKLDFLGWLFVSR